MKIDPSFLSELSQLSFKIKKKVFGKYAGEEKTASAGDGLTFKDFSPYAIGDDVRRIDWKSFARTQEIYVKRYEADRNLTIHVLLDASSSMDYGKGDQNKGIHAAKMAVALAYMYSKHQGRVRFATFSDKAQQAKAFSGSATLQSMLATLQRTKISGSTNLLHSLTEYRQRNIRGKSSIVLFSDFLTDIDEIRKLCANLQRINMTFAHVAHPEEIKLTLRGDYDLVDKESDRKMRVHISPKLINSYNKQFDRHIKSIQSAAQRNKNNYIMLDTGQGVAANAMRLWETL